MRGWHDGKLDLARADYDASYREWSARDNRQAAEIERLKEAVRVRGGCRLLSDGDKCNCGLCVRDNEIERLRQWQLKATLALSACYQSGHREGWQDGPTTNEAMDMVLELVPFPKRYELRDETMRDLSGE
jgi:hypothetical protein